MDIWVKTSALFSPDILENMAEGSPTWQSSDLKLTGAAHLATDGIDDPNYSAGSCSHTADADITEPPVWAVDLRHLTDVNYVEVVNRNIFAGKYIFNELYLYQQIFFEWQLCAHATKFPARNSVMYIKSVCRTPRETQAHGTSLL